MIKERRGNKKGVMRRGEEGNVEITGCVGRKEWGKKIYERLRRVWGKDWKRKMWIQKDGKRKERWEKTLNNNYHWGQINTMRTIHIFFIDKINNKKIKKNKRNQTNAVNFTKMKIT